MNQKAEKILRNKAALNYGLQPVKLFVSNFQINSNNINRRNNLNEIIHTNNIFFKNKWYNKLTMIKFMIII